jgi:hypothetical protein
MQPKYGILFQPDQEEIRTSQDFAQLLESFLMPLLLVLDQVLDKRLVRTAGTKRVGKLIRSLKWSAAHIDRFLLEEANKEVERLKAQGKRNPSSYSSSSSPPSPRATRPRTARASPGRI